MDIRQIRVGLGTVMRVEELELGMGINFGQYSFRGPFDRDISGFFGGQIKLGLQPIPGVLTIGGIGMISLTGTNFQRGSQHFVDNYSIGVYVGVRF